MVQLKVAFLELLVLVTFWSTIDTQTVRDFKGKFAACESGEPTKSLMNKLSQVFSVFEPVKVAGDGMLYAPLLKLCVKVTLKSCFKLTLSHFHQHQITHL